LICGSGIGVSIAANRFPKIYAALCWSPEVAKVAREHDCANILALSADFMPLEIVFDIIKTWLSAEFAGGRYQRRLEMLEIE
jgi:ribose 5-phosphate isomerase B